MLDNIKRLCRERNISLADITRTCGLGKKSIYSWDRSAPSVERVKRVADYLGVTVDDLLRDADQSSERKDGVRGFCLPANVEGVRAVFVRQKLKAADGQAERTAWRNLRDWVLAQMAIIEARQVEVEQVFLPYLTDRQGRTLYEAYKSGRLAIGSGGDAPWDA